MSVVADPICDPRRLSNVNEAEPCIKDDRRAVTDVRQWDLSKALFCMDSNITSIYVAQQVAYMPHQSGIAMPFTEVFRLLKCSKHCLLNNPLH